MRSKAPDLLPIFRSRHQAELLTWLYLHPADEYPMTELAARFGVPLSTTQREVQRLVVAGLLHDRSIGRSRLLRAATGHPAAEALTHLLTVSFGPPAIIGQTFDRLQRVDSVHIYGSWAARYLGQPGPAPNDIDVLVVGSPARADVYAAADVAQDTLGLPVNPTIRSRDQWQDASDALIQQIQASPLVTVIPPAE
ncbi:MarR family transcriptional regulator [Dactylosporangium sp. NBC_01737]|uniref:MarR family winged helix-turn-helix transcriptional regulator n=1 Tax=Dactylosporangium sp. NBC_01737 TaxID=2975959 RepID=UPI002E13DCC1|nr:MarR family transcriptional regulator [Dactylosporangium sp. NBC_01737]